MIRCRNGVLVLVACGWPLFAQTNLEHRAQLLREAVMNPFATNANSARFGYVPTKTPAFSEFVLTTLLQHANRVNTQLALGLPRPITSDHVTVLRVTPKTNVWSGSITVLGRFGFGVREGQFQGFTDSEHAWNRLERDTFRQQTLALNAARMTTNEALAIARSALTKLGYSETSLNLTVTPEVTQYLYEPPDPQKPQPLPLFDVRWLRWTNSQVDRVVMEVSALTSNLARFDLFGEKPAPLPTNYFQMLGVSTNFAEWGTNFGYGKH
jgi:hypothetical protein